MVFLVPIFENYFCYLNLIFFVFSEFFNTKKKKKKKIKNKTCFPCFYFSIFKTGNQTNPN